MKIRAIVLGTIFVIGLALNSTSYAYEGTEDVTKAVQDVVITTKIKGSYLQDKLLNPFDIHVKTDNGQVYLAGTVDTDMQYERAVALAQSVNGVQNVNVRGLVIKDSQAPMDDAYITGKIEGILLRDSIINGDKANFWGIHAETKNSVVYLSGKVDSDKMRQHIINLAQSVDDVKRVRSDLKVDVS
ncbi:MAG: BON domain-containing protein [Gammaproteobacteria bacterium]|nr:BON domain-containing protein [Gammaproteobacteria bacterium]